MASVFKKWPKQLIQPTVVDLRLDGYYSLPVMHLLEVKVYIIFVIEILLWISSLETFQKLHFFKNAPLRTSHEIRGQFLFKSF